MNRIDKLVELYGEDIQLRVSMGVNTQRHLYTYCKTKGYGIRINEIDRIMKKMGYDKYDSPHCLTCGEQEYRKE